MNNSKTNLVITDSLPRVSDSGSKNLFYRIFDFLKQIVAEIKVFLAQLCPWLKVHIDSRTLARLIQSSKKSLPDLRPSLRIEALPIIPAGRTHTHSKSASERTSASKAIDQHVREAGREPYYVSMSSADQRDDCNGNRFYYWPKDLKAEFCDDFITSNHSLVFIDVDMHVDMPRYLQLGLPMIMYTVVAESPAYQCAEFSYKFKDNVMHYEVSGGAVYEHELWNYDHETLAADCDDGYTIFYNVEQRVIAGHIGESHRILLILPYAKIKTRYAFAVNPTYLTRKQYTFDGVNMVYDSLTDKLSVAMNDSYHAVTIEGRRYEALRVKLSSKAESRFTVGDVEIYLYDEKQTEQTESIKVTAALLHEIFVTNGSLPMLTNIIKTSAVPTFYVPVAPLALQNPTAPCQLLTTPLVSYPGLHPAKCTNSEIAAIRGRITAVENNKIPPREYSKYARDFIDWLVDEPHKGVPLTMEQVYDNLERPLQKARARDVKHRDGMFARNRLQTFNKNEAYKVPSDPRIITTCETASTLELARYTDAFKQQVLKKHDWYGPGKTPAQSIEILRKVTTNGSIETDYTRFDGSISRWLQTRIVFEVYTRWCNPSEKDAVLYYLKQIFKKSGRTSTGISYSAGWGTRSGSKITTDGNTAINCFIVYAALRTRGYDHDTAVKHLGIYAGDDGITPALPGLAEAITATCVDLGLDVKMKVNGRNEKLTYLSRVFPCIQTHDDSFQDPVRTLMKIHLSANKGVTREQAATNKAVGYMTTDALTPIVSDYCKRVLAITQLQPKGMTSEEEHKIQSGAWPQNDHQLIQDAFCKELNITTIELAEKVDLIKKVKDLDSFPVVLNVKETQPKLDAIVLDTLVFAPRPRLNNEKQENEQKCNQTRTQEKSIPKRAKRKATAPPTGDQEQNRHPHFHHRSNRAQQTDSKPKKSEYSRTPKPSQTTRKNTHASSNTSRASCSQNNKDSKRAASN